MSKRIANTLVDAGALIIALYVTMGLRFASENEPWTRLSVVMFSAAMLVGISLLAYGAINGVAIRVAEQITRINKGKA